jgi:hypothetical protein
MNAGHSRIASPYTRAVTCRRVWPKGTLGPRLFHAPHAWVSVYLTQQTSQHLCRAFIPADRYVINNKDLASGPLAVIYIDDFALTCLAEHLIASYASHGRGHRGSLATRAPTGERFKRVAPTSDTAPVLGNSLRNTGLGPILSPINARAHPQVGWCAHHTYCDKAAARERTWSACWGTGHGASSYGAPPSPFSTRHTDLRDALVPPSTHCGPRCAKS